MRRVAGLLLIGMALALSACGASGPIGPEIASDQQITQLAKGLSALGPDVDPEEAERAARIAYQHTYELAQRYRITDAPLVHNTKVNMGLKPRGLCYHWADDMEAQLRQEGFRTLQLHRAIANSDNPFRIEHSTVIVSRRGDGMFDGMVLDPWRKGGRLTWVLTATDPDYRWKPRQQVFREKGLIPAK